MKILFLSISYKEAQENIYTDLVRELLESDHEVTVVTSNDDKIYSAGSLRVYGINKPVTQKKNLIAKGMSTLFAGLDFSRTIKRHLMNESFDLVLYATPPITLNRVVKFCKKKYKCKSYLMLKDIFPQNAADLGMLSEKNPIHLYFRMKEKELYKLSDYIGCMSQGNVDYLLNHNQYLDKNKVGVFYNSIKIGDFQSHGASSTSDTTFIFGGNMGAPQNISGLLGIIEECAGIPEAKFVLVGKGTEVSKITNYIKDKRPTNLVYHEFLARDEYEKLLLSADVGVISLDPRFTIPNIPSKLPTYMNLRKPIIAFTDVNTDLKDIIKQSDCGWWFDAKNKSSIIEGINMICSNKELQRSKGNNGFDYLVKNFDVKINVKQLEDFFENS